MPPPSLQAGEQKAEVTNPGHRGSLGRIRTWPKAQTEGLQHRLSQACHMHGALPVGKPGKHTQSWRWVGPGSVPTEHGCPTVACRSGRSEGLGKGTSAVQDYYSCGHREPPLVRGRWGLPAFFPHQPHPQVAHGSESQSLFRLVLSRRRKNSPKTDFPAR